MLVKSAKMTNNLDKHEIFKNIIQYFEYDEPSILPHVWLSSENEWNIVYTMLIEKRFIQDTITLVKNIKNINLNPKDVQRAFYDHRIGGSIFFPCGMYDDSFNKFYYQ